jgi:predicted metal-dependent phosphoesterase TrpH
VTIPRNVSTEGKMKIDLHIHTTYSDGLLTPAQVVQKARQLNLRFIAITDHDTTEGIPEALEEAKKNNNLEVIPGIEINTDYKNEEVHILGYYVDYSGNYLKKALEHMQSSRLKRAKLITEKLNLLGLNINLEEVMNKASCPSIGRPHIAAALVEKGFSESLQDAFDKYLNRGRPAYVPRERLTPFEAVDLVLNSSGIPILAHPGLIKNQNIIGELIQYGIKGLEVYHKEHSRLQTKHYINVAKHHSLLMTGGSDCHGREPLLLGTLDIPVEFVLKLKRKKGLI